MRSNTSGLRPATGSIQPAWRPKRSNRRPSSTKPQRAPLHRKIGTGEGRRPCHRRVSPRPAMTVRISGSKSSSKGKSGRLSAASRGAGGSRCLARACPRPTRPGERAVAGAELERRLHHDDLRVPRLQADRAVEGGIEGEDRLLGDQHRDPVHLDHGGPAHPHLGAARLLVAVRDEATVGQEPDPPASVHRPLVPRESSVPPTLTVMAAPTPASMARPRRGNRPRSPGSARGPPAPGAAPGRPRCPRGAGAGAVGGLGEAVGPPSGASAGRARQPAAGWPRTFVSAPTPATRAGGRPARPRRRAAARRRPRPR